MSYCVSHSRAARGGFCRFCPAALNSTLPPEIHGKLHCMCNLYSLSKGQAAIHPKAMPVILTTPQEIKQWMTASTEASLKLQRPLPDGALRIVARGTKQDG